MKTTQLTQKKKITKRLQFAVGCGIHNKNKREKKTEKKINWQTFVKMKKIVVLFFLLVKMVFELCGY